MFAHLNTHSIYSKMRGTIPLMKLITRTKRLHMSHIALTEVNGLWGFIRFVQLAKEQGIKAIAGTNLITEMDNVILLAENQTGYENMCRIISSIHDDPDASIPNLLAHQDSVLVSLATFIPNSHFQSSGIFDLIFFPFYDLNTLGRRKDRYIFAYFIWHNNHTARVH